MQKNVDFIKRSQKNVIFIKKSPKKVNLIKKYWGKKVDLIKKSLFYQRTAKETDRKMWISSKNCGKMGFSLKNREKTQILTNIAEKLYFIKHCKKLQISSNIVNKPFMQICQIFKKKKLWKDCGKIPCKRSYWIFDFLSGFRGQINGTLWS